MDEYPVPLAGLIVKRRQLIPTTDVVFGLVFVTVKKLPVRPVMGGNIPFSAQTVKLNLQQLQMRAVMGITPEKKIRCRWNVAGPVSSID